MAIVERFSGNPILTSDDVPYPVVTVHNAGVAKHNGRYYMVFRSHRHTADPSLVWPRATVASNLVSGRNPS